MLQQTEIERAKPEDAEIICDIRDRAWIEAYPNAELGITKEQIELNAKGLDGIFVPRRIAHIKNQLTNDAGDGLTIFVATINNKVVGYVEPLSDTDGRKWISAIYISPEFQGMGIGSKLMEHALKLLGHTDNIYLEVVKYNQNAIRFYKKFGFLPTDTEVAEDERQPSYMISIPQLEMVLPKRVD